MTMMSSRIQRWRWLVKALLVAAALGVPFLHIRGQSAFRFDVPSLQLHFFGATVSMDQFFLVLVVILFLSFFIVFLTILFGRIWCGWLCPQTVLVELTGFIDRPGRQGIAYRVLATGALLAISVLLSADIIWYFVEPGRFLAGIRAGTLGTVERWSWIVLSSLTFLNFQLLRRTFCVTVCPYAKLQGALFDDRTLVIAGDAGRMDLCMHCDACLRACPVGIDVRKGLQSECVACARCIDACAQQMKRRDLASLIGYRFGVAPIEGGLLRRPVVLSGAATTVFILLFIGLLAASEPVDMDISQDPAAPPVRLNDTTVVNSYFLLLTNRTDSPKELAISAKGSEGPVQAVPDTVLLQTREHRQIRLTLRAEGASRLRSSSERVVVQAVSRDPSRVRLERKTVMLQPW